MSHEESRYKKFKLEVSVEDCKVVFAPDLWPWGMRIRPFFRNRYRDNDEDHSRRRDSVSMDLR